VLAGRSSQFAVVDACLDHALGAMVMYDHVCDWQDDLAAGRWNIFVARYGSNPQRPGNASANRSSVFAAMMARRAVADQFALIGAELRRAARAATELGSEPLRTYLVGLTDRLGQEANLLEQHYAALGDAALALVFGTREPREGGALPDGRRTEQPALG
jgi:hypothetical protein